MLLGFQAPTHPRHLLEFLKTHHRKNSFFVRFFFFLAAPSLRCPMGDLSCKLQDLIPSLGIKPRLLCIGSLDTQPLDHQGSNQQFLFKEQVSGSD